MKNFWQVADGIEVQPLLDQLADVPTAKRDEEGYPYFGPVKWRKMTEWTWRKSKDVAIYNEYNIVLRYVTATNDKGKIRPVKWHSLHPPGTLGSAWPIVEKVNAAAGGDPNCVGHVILTRLPKGGKIGKHIDQPPRLADGSVMPGFPYWQRHQVPLAVSPGVVFGCGGEELYMKPGFAFGFKAQQEHWVHNGSGRDRLSMIVEIRPTSSCT